MKMMLARNKFSFWCNWTKNNNYMQLRGGIRSVSYYEWYLSAPIKIMVPLISVEMNQRMLKIINFSDGYKVTTNAFSMLLTVCWNRLMVWWNRLTLTNRLLMAELRWLMANRRFQPLRLGLGLNVSVRFLVWGHIYAVSRVLSTQTFSLAFLCSEKKPWILFIH